MGWLRRPKTRAEARVSADPEVEEFVRAARAPHNLPDAWDDIMVRCSRSWKDQRRGVRSWDR